MDTDAGVSGVAEVTETPVVTETPAAEVTEATPPAGTEQPGEKVEVKGEGEQPPEGEKKEEPHVEQPQETDEDRSRRIAREEFERQRETERQRLEEEAKNRPVEVRPLLNMEKVNAHLADLKQQIEAAELAGDIAKALDLDDELREFRASVKKYNEERDGELQASEAQQRQTEFLKKVNSDIDVAAKDIATQRKIPKEIWDQGQTWFKQACQSDVVLYKRYSEMVMRQGPYAAVEWAIEYVQNNMGKGAKNDQAAKNAAKGKAPDTSGTATGPSAATAGPGGVVIDGVAINSWGDLNNISSAKINAFARKSPKAWQAFKDKCFR